MNSIRVTVDTNMLDPSDIEGIKRAARDVGLDLDLTMVSVSVRERGEFDGSGIPSATTKESGVWAEAGWDQAAWGIEEPFVLDESALDVGTLQSLSGCTRFDAILAVISNGSFPRPGGRDGLTAPQKRQLRDAMILEAHARDGRDVFVTRDSKGFINHGKREALQALCSTEIALPTEFADWCERYAASDCQR